MKSDSGVPEAVELFNEIQKQPKQLFDMIRVEVRETVGQYLTSLMNTELTHFLGGNPYERVEGAQNHRNGSYNRKFTLKDLGEVKVNVPGDRQGNFKNQVIPANQQYEKVLRQDPSMMFLTGISTRILSMLAKKLIDRSISPAGIRNANKELNDSAGPEKVFKEEFPNAKVQRCQVHVARNVLAKVPGKLKKTAADNLKSIFYASSEKKALEFFNLFKMKWEKDLPSAVKCLGNSIDSCLTFFMCPDEEWISSRTTNIIERLNKEFKRRTKPMEIVAGKNACYTLQGFYKP